MILAIVGTSHLSENEERDARKRIVWIIQDYKKQIEKSQSLGHLDYLEIITGDADGIDKLVAEIADSQRVYKWVYKSKGKEWKYYKERNLEIAKDCDYCISITTQTKREQCYHCNKNHQRTGGCFTLKMARNKYGKEGEVVIV